MKDLTFSQVYSTNFISSWPATISTIRTPLIAAVNGVALGGGCELALMTDIIYCSSTATFGQPEIKLGIIPGAGGSQRLTRAIGKSRAMELILTGKNFSGTEAGEWGVAARVFGTSDECVQGALETAERIAAHSKIAVMAAKEVVNKSQEIGLRDGLEYERKVFHSLFGSKDQKIGKFERSSSKQLWLWEQLTVLKGWLLSSKKRSQTGQMSDTHELRLKIVNQYNPKYLYFASTYVHISPSKSPSCSFLPTKPPYAPLSPEIPSYSPFSSAQTPVMARPGLMKYPKKNAFKPKLVFESVNCVWQE